MKIKHTLLIACSFAAVTASHQSMATRSVQAHQQFSVTNAGGVAGLHLSTIDTEHNVVAFKDVNNYKKTSHLFTEKIHKASATG